METNTGKLYIVSTPIGNLGDITRRALDALGASDVVYAEDTRVTGKLLAAFDLKKPLCRLDENTIRHKADEVVERVRGGETIAYCTDAGMPAVSDPGCVLVDRAHEVDIPCEVLPGASAASLAYVASGFACPNFYFGGFFPRKQTERESLLRTLASLDAVLVFYESPHRLLEALRALEHVLPHRRVCVCRELTKLHEEVFRGSIGEVREHFEEMERVQGIKGEIALVVDAPSTEEGVAALRDDLNAARVMMSELLDAGERVKDVASKTADAFNIPRNDAYALALEIKKSRS